MVGMGRFELPTPRTPSECSTRLSHIPTVTAQARRWGNSILPPPEREANQRITMGLGKGV